MSTQTVCLFALGVIVTPGLLAQTAADFFATDTLHDIFITSEHWKTLQDNFQDDTYYPAEVRWRDQIIANAGIRSKGRTSRRAAKPGLKVDIDRFQDQTFLGLKAFVLDNSIQDYTTIKERVAMELFTKMGLPAPRETHARVFVNGEYLGLYVLAEEIDKTFLTRSLGENKGYLYEVELIPGFYLNHLGDEPELYVPFPFKPETHEDAPDADVVAAMIRAINLTSDEDFVAEVSKYVDVEKYLTQAAVENYIAEYDGMIAGHGINNVYFYRPAGQTRGFFFPKDKDNAFQSYDWPILLHAELHPLMRRALAVPAWREHYLNELQRAAAFAGGPGGWLETEFLRIAGQIRDAAHADAVKECPDGACSLEASNYFFDLFVNFVAEQIRNRPTYVESEVAAVRAGSPAATASAAAYLKTGRLTPLWQPFTSHHLGVVTGLQRQVPEPCFRGLSIGTGRWRRTRRPSRSWNP